MMLDCYGCRHLAPIHLNHVSEEYPDPDEIARAIRVHMKLVHSDQFDEE